MSEIARCEYCGRGMYLSEGDTCKGCGSPFPPKIPRHDALQVLYDASRIEIRDFVGRPGVNIPVRRFSDLDGYVHSSVEALSRLIIPIR